MLWAALESIISHVMRIAPYIQPMALIIHAMINGHYVKHKPICWNLARYTHNLGVDLISNQSEPILVSPDRNDVLPQLSCLRILHFLTFLEQCKIWKLLL